MKKLNAAVITLAILPFGAFAADAGFASMSNVSQTTPDAPSTPPADAPTTAQPAKPAGTATAAPTQPTTAEPPTAAQLAADPTKQPGGVTILAFLDHYMGTGTFLRPETQSYLAGTLTLSPRYLFSAFGKRFTLAGNWGVTWEYTPPDSDNGRRVSPTDVRLSLVAPGFFKERNTGLVINPSIGLTVPTTLESWGAGLITNLSAGIGVVKNIWILNLSANVSGSRGFHTSPVVAARAPQRANDNTLTVICRGAETSSCGGFSQNNVAWGLSGSLNVNANFTDEWSASFSYSLGKSWVYASDEFAEYSSRALDSNGNPVIRTGLAQRDRSLAYFGVNYQATAHWAFSLGAFTVQAPKADNASNFRFPFWATDNAATNATQLDFTITAFY